MTALIDTGFMLAVLSYNDLHHEACCAVLASESDARIPSVVLPELAYMTLRDVNRSVFIQFMRTLSRNPSKLALMVNTDFERATDIMEKYADSKIDFVDCAIVAVAERLNISRILTVDRRDFSILRPRHVPAFEILP